MGWKDFLIRKKIWCACILSKACTLQNDYFWTWKDLVISFEDFLIRKNMMCVHFLSKACTLQNDYFATPIVRVNFGGRIKGNTRTWEQ